MKTEPQDIIVKPGETVLVAITFPEELDESEACCAGIILEDFLASRNAAEWMPRVHSVLSNVPHHLPGTAGTQAAETKETL